MDLTKLPNGFYRISIKALILDDQKRFLLVQEDNGKWELPGGGLNFDESPQECIIREIKEEMGLQVTYVATQPAYFLTSDHSKGFRLANVLYETRVENVNFTPSEECVALRFFTAEEALRENVFSNVREFAEMYKQPARVE